MSELKLGLIIAGAAIVALVYLYNRIQERRERLKLGLPTSVEPAQIEERQEPSFRELDITTEPERSAAIPRADQPIVKLPPIEETGTAPDATIESIVYLRATQPIAASVLADSSKVDLGKPLRWYGKHNERWRACNQQESYTELAAGLQLANRSGAISELELKNFQQLLNFLGTQLHAEMESPDWQVELKRAQALDQQCAEVDWQVGINLLRSDGQLYLGTRLRGVAEANGFRLSAKGEFNYYHEDTGSLLFSLSNAEPGHPFTAQGMKQLQSPGFSFILDLPRVSEPLKAFDQLKLIAKRMALALEGELFDDQRKPLNDSAFAAIRTRLQETVELMRSRGIEPGSAKALRLFS